MFVRQRRYKDKKGRTITYLQLVESYREDGKVKQRVIGSFTGFESLEQAYQAYKRIEANWPKELRYRRPNSRRCFYNTTDQTYWGTFSYGSLRKKLDKLERAIQALPCPRSGKDVTA